MFYANTINQMSDIDQMTKGSTGQPVPFAYAFFPWCFYWLIVYVLQVGGNESLLSPASVFSCPYVLTPSSSYPPFPQLLFSIHLGLLHPLLSFPRPADVFSTLDLPCFPTSDVSVPPPPLAFLPIPPHPFAPSR